MKLPVLQATRRQEPSHYDETMLTNPIVGIAGLKGAGKTELMTRIMRRVSGDVINLPFSGPLKEVAKRMGWDGKKNVKGRLLLQLLGTECGRKCISEDVWVDLWQDQVGPRVRGGYIVFTDDVRFQNEVEVIREWGGMLIKVYRPGTKVRRKWWQVRARRAHLSEVPPDDDQFNFIFDNDGDIDDIDWFAQVVADIIDRRFPCTPPST